MPVQAEGPAVVPNPPKLPTAAPVLHANPHIPAPSIRLAMQSAETYPVVPGREGL